MNTLHGLNEKQIEAVTHKDGPLLVIAGPGTGKTEVIIRRIAYLIRPVGIKPEKILALTFTNDAAKEMRKSVTDQASPLHGTDVKITNFHSFCVSVLRKISDPETLAENEIVKKVIRKLNINTHFTIFDQEVQDEILKETIRELNLSPSDYPPWWLRNIIRESKCKLQDPINVIDKEDLERLRTVEHLQDVLQVYQHKLDEYDALDFDDLFVKTVKLLRTKEIKEIYDKEMSFSYILVDEFHDVNRAQYCLLQLLCTPSEQNLMVVADKNQSIDHWRWSDPHQYIKSFKDDFDPSIIELNEHYRCSEKILRAAEGVIVKNPKHQEQHIFKIHKDAGRDIFHYTFDTPIAEARDITKIIQKLVTQRGYSYSDIAVFYRTDELSDILAGQLLQTGINFDRIRSTNFKEEEKHRQDILSYLRFIQWELPHDLERSINFPEVRIDELTLARLKQLAQRKNIEFIKLLKNIEAYTQDVGPLTCLNVRQFWTQIEKLSTKIDSEKIDKTLSILFGTLDLCRSPYRTEELEVIEKQPEVPNLSTAQDILYSALNLDEPIQITASHGIDEYAAAHIIHQTLETYLSQSVQLQFLSPDDNKPTQLDNGVHLLIGDFEELGEKGQDARIILIGTADTADRDVIHLKTEGVRSIATLKLCQRLISRFETAKVEDIVIYDFETTGLDLKEANIIQIAALHLNATEDNTIKHIKDVEDKHEFNHYVKPPGGHIPKSSIIIHGITPEKVQHEPSIEIVLPKFCEFIQDRILVGHNIEKFDNQILKRDLRRHLERDLSASYYDTLTTARRLFPRQRCSIGALAEKFKIKHENPHDALGDVRVNKEIFKELVKRDAYKREVKSLTELLPLVGVGILAKTELSQAEVASTEEVETSKPEVTLRGPTLTESNAFLNAAVRFVQTHRPYLLHHLSFNPEEKRRVGTLLRQLERSKIPTESSEDAKWNRHRAKFMNEVSAFESVGLSYENFLNHLNKADTDSECLRLMKLHATRGREFPVVIIIGMEQESFPMWKQNITKEEIEAERRLFYVGMTRAQEQLYLSSTKYRFGDRSVSIFVREVPSNYVIKWPQPRRA
ncbi:MAG: UvrD-helicase domain-containing protein [Candidatus Poribacteria bacterium]|nr:UvrD-helicase domain-containing protein [Candidatus Poribacteria bacterium]